MCITKERNMTSRNPIKTRLQMADKERILSLEGQVAELSDRLAEYEHAEMLRRVSEEDASQTYHREEVRDFDERTFIPLAPPVLVDGPAPSARQ